MLVKLLEFEPVMTGVERCAWMCHGMKGKLVTVQDGGLTRVAGSAVPTLLSEHLSRFASQHHQARPASLVDRVSRSLLSSCLLPSCSVVFCTLRRVPSSTLTGDRGVVSTASPWNKGNPLTMTSFFLSSILTGGDPDRRTCQ